MIEKYISELLHNHECVVVPDFGAFITNYHPARIDPARQRMQPPSKLIAFNRSLRSNDALLAHHISQVEEFNFVNALEKLRDTVNEWNQKIDERGSLKLDGLGLFKKSGEGQIRFIPDKKHNYLLNAYGLSEINLRPVKRESHVMFDNEGSSRQEHRKQRILKRSLYAAASVAAVFLIFSVLLFTWTPLKQNNEGNLNPLEIHDGQHTVNKDLDTAPEQIDHIGHDHELTPDHETLEIPPETDTAEVNDTVKPPREKFYIIGGSFQSEANARRFSNRLNEKGFDGEILHTETGFFRVSYTSLADSTEAAKRIGEIRNIENPSAWILKQ